MSKIQHPNVIRLKEVNWDATYEKKNGTKVTNSKQVGARR